MCDTIYRKIDGRTFFGKNSDRDPNEAHLVIRQPARDISAGTTLKTTYTEIPEVTHTYACVLMKPHWMWGAEMGWNEFGLNIGNEALFTDSKREKQNGLLGMDMLRLALERCATALQAADLIISLVEKYGQTGNCGWEKKFYYDNAFLIADPNEAYVLETVGRSWALKKADETETISNSMSIGTKYFRCSNDVTGDFCKHQNNLFTAVAGAKTRKASTYKIISEDGDVCRNFVKALSGHSSNKVTVNTSSTDSVCMHAGNMFGDHTTGSYFGEIDKVYYVTGSSFPCLSLFRPLTPEAEILPADEKTALEFWLKREKLHRLIMSGNIDITKYKRQAAFLQEKFFAAAENAKTKADLQKVSLMCCEEEQQFADEFLSTSEYKKIHIKGTPYFKRYWNNKTRRLENEYE